MKLTKLQLENLIRGEISSTLREASLEYGLEDTTSPVRRSRQAALDDPIRHGEFQSEEERMAAYNQVRATMKPVVADEKTGKYLVTIEIVDPERTWETAEDVTIDLGEELLVPYLRDIFKTADYVLG
jgi:hypothetical protein